MFEYTVSRGGIRLKKKTKKKRKRVLVIATCVNRSFLMGYVAVGHESEREAWLCKNGERV